MERNQIHFGKSCYRKWCWEWVCSFFLSDVENHEAVDIDLPTLARLIDHDEINDDYHELVIVIQFESTSEYDVVGYRKFNSETGSSLPYELKFLRDWEIEEFNLLAKKDIW